MNEAGGKVSGAPVWPPCPDCGTGWVISASGPVATDRSFGCVRCRRRLLGAVLERADVTAPRLACVAESMARTINETLSEADRNDGRLSSGVQFMLLDSLRDWVSLGF